MNYRSLGKHLSSISEIGIGTWAFGGAWGAQADADSINALHHALDRGVNFIDTAAGYGNGRAERVVARALLSRRAAGNATPVHVCTKTPPVTGPWPPSPYCVASERYPETYLRQNLVERLDCLECERIDILLLHTWTRAWNRDPSPLKTLRQFQREGLVGLIGVSSPEHDQNALVDLIRGGWVDVVEIIYNLFEQEPAAELLDAAAEHGVGVIVRVVFDEGALTGKFTSETVFPPDDFRSAYFAGDRLARTVARVEKVRADLVDTGYTLPQAAIKFALAHPAVSTVIPGMRTLGQVEANCAASALPDLSPELLKRLRRHNWLRAFWNFGK